MDDSYWDQRIETLPRATLARLQQHRLNWQLRRCWDGSPFYRQRLEAAGLDPSAFADPDVLARLPILHQSELLAEAAANPPHGRLTVAPEAWWVEADEGQPEALRVWTDGDVSHSADLAARALWAASAGTSTRCFVGNGIDQRADFESRVDAAVEAGLARLRSQVTSAGDTPRSMHIVWADRAPAPPSAIGPLVDPFHVFGLVPVAPTLAYECDQRQGLHWAEDHVLVEVLDPETGLPTLDGAAGELVLTDLTREGSPLLRFALRRMAALETTPCACGRTSARSRDIRLFG